MTNAADAFLLGGGGASAKFEQIGDQISGRVISTEVTAQTDIGTGKPLTWDDGSIREQLVVSLQTDLKDDADDDGVRKLYVKGSKKAGCKSMHDAVASAVRQARANGLTPGGTLTVRFVGTEPAATRGFNDRKLFEASFVPPSGGDFLGTTATPPAAPAPAPAAAPVAAQAPAPAQAAPQPNPALAAAGANMSPEQLQQMQQWMSANAQAPGA